MANTMDEKYSKWDHFDDEDDEKDIENRIPTRFDLGDGNLIVKDVMHISDEDIRDIKTLNLQEKVIWQVVFRKLRVFSASSKGTDVGEGVVPCRPYCMFISNLFPMGRLLSRRICEIPERQQLPGEILCELFDLMKNPPDAGIARHRPTQIVFEDAEVAGELSNSLKAIGIECTVLSAADGLDDIVREFSKILVDKDVATTGGSSDQPGILQNCNTISEDQVHSFYESASVFMTSKPWEYIGPRQGICINPASTVHIHGEADSATTGRIYVSVLGGNDENGPTYTGIAIFDNQVDMENRVLNTGEKIATNIGVGRMCNSCDTTERELKRNMKRCTRCQRAFYCTSECQRNDWINHKKTCSKSSLEVNGVTWSRREISCLFEEYVNIPFDDLDSIDRLKLPVTGEKGYPLPLVHRFGTPDRPTASELLLMERVFRVFPAIMESNDVNGLLGTKHIGDATATFVINTFGASGGSEKVTVTNNVVLTEEEAIAFDVKQEE